MIIGISGKIGSGKDTIGKIIQYLTACNNSDLARESMYFDEWDKGDFHSYHNDDDNFWRIKKFAYKLKQIVSILTGYSVEDLEKEEIKNTSLGANWGGIDQFGHDFTYTVRLLLQKIGTEAMREVIHSNIWVNALFSEYKSKFADKDGLTTYTGDITFRQKDHPLFEPNNFPNWIITDVRFPNEAKAILDRNGILIRVNRPTYNINNINSFEHPSENSLDNFKGFKYLVNNNGTIDDLVKNVRQILLSESII